MDVFRNPVGLSRAELAIAQQRKARLESLSSAVSVFCGVFFGAVFVAAHPRATSAVWGLVFAFVAAAVVVGYRKKRPARIAERQLIQVPKGPDVDAVTADGAEERAGWDFSNVVIAAIFLPPMVLLGLLAVCWFPILIIVGFTIQAQGEGGLGIALAIACTFAVVGAVEYGIILPLCRRWRLPEFD